MSDFLWHAKDIETISRRATMNALGLKSARSLDRENR